MDRRERTGSLLVAVQAALRGHQADMWTALPAVVQSFDATKLTVAAQPTIQAQVRTPGGDWVNVTLPVCVDCPVEFPGGGGFVLTFPIAAGDEGVLVFASRCIDAWWQSGGVQPQAELRMHDLSDGFFFPQVFSQPRAPANVSTTAAQLRSIDGTVSVEVGAGEITLKATNVIVQGNLQISGAIEAVGGGIYAGNLRTSGDVVAMAGTGGSVTLSTHKHTQPADSHGDTEAQTNSPTGGT